MKFQERGAPSGIIKKRMVKEVGISAAHAEFQILKDGVHDAGNILANVLGFRFVLTTLLPQAIS